MLQRFNLTWNHGTQISNYAHSSINLYQVGKSIIFSAVCLYSCKDWAFAVPLGSMGELSTLLSWLAPIEINWTSKCMSLAGLYLPCLSVLKIAKSLVFFPWTIKAQFQVRTISFWGFGSSRPLDLSKKWFSYLTRFSALAYVFPQLLTALKSSHWAGTFWNLFVY